MSDYANKSPAEISSMINKILTRTVRRGDVRGVSRELTAEWFEHICNHLTTEHSRELASIESNWATSKMENKLKYMEIYRSIIEEVRHDGMVIEESDDHDWTWDQLTLGAGSLMNMIVFMIKKSTGTSTSMTMTRELQEKMRRCRIS